ncbi:hypothetical protein CCGE531_11635 [Rhizobium sp. CCGE531]|nr:hypothetical protein CCGE531_11635 [Rhizobium sp. CCGE531]AYG72957.1 hypothetical protein CCGE532_11060 [Rhizobium sp. CCGE532]
MLKDHCVFLASNTSVRWSISDTGMDNRGCKGIFALVGKNVALGRGLNGRQAICLEQRNVYERNPGNYSGMRIQMIKCSKGDTLLG